MLELFHIIADPDCAKVRRKIMELGLKGHVDFRNIDASQAAKEDLKKLTGGIKVPSLRNDNTVITGADAIIKFLETKA